MVRRKKVGGKEMKMRVKKTMKQERCVYIQSRKVLLTIYSEKLRN